MSDRTDLLVVGGSEFIGCEAAASFARRGVSVVLANDWDEAYEHGREIEHGALLAEVMEPSLLI